MFAPIVRDVISPGPAVAVGLAAVLGVVLLVIAAVVLAAVLIVRAAKKRRNRK